MNNTAAKSQTVQEMMKTTLLRSGIPAKGINVYGNQIVVTAWSLTAANKWASLLTKFATVRGTVESMDYCKENKNTVMLPSAVKVWRVFARI